MEQVQKPSQMSSWRFKGIGVLRIIFGLVWAVDAWFKWQPDFINNFSDYLTGTLEGQPPAVQSWINFWINIIKVDPHVFAHIVAISETALAVGLILGVFSNLTNLVGILLSVVIWSTAEGFGGPYVPGSADIGSAIIYALVFAALFLANAGLSIGIDRWLTPKLGRWGILASGPIYSIAEYNFNHSIHIKCQKDNKLPDGIIIIEKHRLPVYFFDRGAVNVRIKDKPDLLI